MIRLFIADDHPIVRMGVRQALMAAPEIEIIGEAADGVAVMTDEAVARADVLLLDLQLPGKSGWEVLRRLRARHPQLRVVILTVQEEALSALQALKMGAAGYLTKGCAPQIYIRAIRKVHEGGSYISEEIASALAGMMASDSTPGKEAYDLLSERELQVFFMIASGKRATDIAEELSISIKTASAHKRNILKKLNLKTGSDIVRYAIRANLLV